MCCPTVRLKRQGFSKCSHRVREISALGERGAQVGVRSRICGIERHSLAKLGNRVQQIAPAHEERAEPVMRLGRSRRNFHSLLKRLESTLVIVCIPVSLAELDVTPGIAPFALERGLKLRYRRCNVAFRGLRYCGQGPNSKENQHHPPRRN